MANDIGGVWRTVGGRRIFIKEGQDLTSAMKASGKFNSSNNKKLKKQDKIFDDFKNSDGSKEYFEEALNKISEMEYNNEINPDEYKEYISKIQKEYADKKKSEKTTNDTNEYEYNLYKQAKENPDSINPMTEMSTDWEDLDKRFKDRYEKENQKWLTEKDSNWLKNQGHDTELEKKIKNFKPSGDIENDERRLEDISSNYFYDEVGIYNENIDSTATKWAHDKAVELNDKNKQDSKTKLTDNEDKISTKQFKEASKIDEPLERAIQMQVADDVGKTLNDDDIRFRAENYIKNNYKGEASTEEIYEKLKSAYKNNGAYENNKDSLMTAEQLKGKDKELLAQIQEETDSMAYKELLGEYNAGKLTSADLEDTLKNLKKFNSDTDDLMTAEQLKGKDREEQKEINKQYLKEQNKLAQEKNDANFAKEWYEGTKKTKNMAKDNLERAKRNGASVEELSNRTRQVHELELESQKAQQHANKMNARANSNNLENKYKISKTNNGKEYMRTISPYDETEYAYAEKRNDSWYVKDPTKKTGNGSSQTHIYNDVNEARAKMEEINNRIKGNSENSGKNYEGVTYNNYKKEEVNESSIDHRNEPKTSSDVMNANIRNAYQEYKKKHPGSKINFSKFKDDYKS